MRNVTLRNIDVAVKEGPKLAISNVTGRGLDDAVALKPTSRPAPVPATEPSYRFGMTTGQPN
jgi:hypothetical protein